MTAVLCSPKGKFHSYPCIGTDRAFSKTETMFSATDDSAAITLMSTDVEKIRQGMIMMHEFWANTIEVGFASFLLYRSLGIAFLAPILIVVVVIGLAAGLSTFVSSQTS